MIDLTDLTDISNWQEIDDLITANNFNDVLKIMKKSNITPDQNAYLIGRVLTTFRWPYNLLLHLMLRKFSNLKWRYYFIIFTDPKLSKFLLHSINKPSLEFLKEIIKENIEERASTIDYFVLIRCTVYEPKYAIELAGDLSMISKIKYVGWKCPIDGLLVKMAILNQPIYTFINSIPPQSDEALVPDNQNIKKIQKYKYYDSYYD